MEVGLLGVRGGRVLSRVGAEVDQEQEHAPIHHEQTVDDNVQDRAHQIKVAQRTVVIVSATSIDVSSCLNMTY